MKTKTSTSRGEMMVADRATRTGYFLRRVGGRSGQDHQFLDAPGRYELIDDSEVMPDSKGRSLREIWRFLNTFEENILARDRPPTLNRYFRKR